MLGPLEAGRGPSYFEIEVLEMEPGRTQTMAIGVVCGARPTGKSLRAERARDLPGSVLLGYDLPKLCVDGAEVQKICTKQWRPLKDLAVASRVGLLFDNHGLTVFIDGVKRTSAALTLGDRLSGEVYGLVDVHGAVRSVRLRPPQETRSSSLRPVCEDVSVSSARTASAVSETPDRTPAASPTTSQADLSEAEGPRRGATRPLVVPVPAGPKKRFRVASFTSCSAACLVHLRRNTGEVECVPRKGDLTIGRDPNLCNLVLDSDKVPGLVSKRHAVITSEDLKAVAVTDCESLNGTFVNSKRILYATLRDGDVLSFGQPNICPEDMKLHVLMP